MFDILTSPITIECTCSLPATNVLSFIDLNPMYHKMLSVIWYLKLLPMVTSREADLARLGTGVSLLA